MKDKNQKIGQNTARRVPTLEPAVPSTALQGALKSMSTENLAETLELINEIDKLWKSRRLPAAQDHSLFKKVLH